MPEPTDPVAAPAPPVRVLVIDAHPVVRLGVKAVLADAPGLAVVGDGPCDVGPAVRMAAAMAPGVAVVGGPAAEAVAAGLREGVGCRVLVLSACEDAAEARRALAAGASGYALKRSPADDLVRAVRAVAAGDTYLDPAVAHAAVAAPAHRLSEQEVQVLKLIARGYTHKEIAARLRVSVKTVEIYKARGLKKLGLEGRVDVVRLAVRQGWLTDDKPSGGLHVGDRGDTAG